MFFSNQQSKPQYYEKDIKNDKKLLKAKAAEIPHICKAGILKF